MEHVPGVQLSTIWRQMNDEQQVTCIRNLVALVKQMHALEFPAYGSIYFTDSPVDDSQRIRLADGFCVGPHCDTRYWPRLGEPRFYDRTPPNRGPCEFWAGTSTAPPPLRWLTSASYRD